MTKDLGHFLKTSEKMTVPKLLMEDNSDVTTFHTASVDLNIV